jgi:hypothetical protein
MVYVYMAAGGRLCVGGGGGGGGGGEGVRSKKPIAHGSLKDIMQRFIPKKLLVVKNVFMVVTWKNRSEGVRKREKMRAVSR